MTDNIDIQRNRNRHRWALLAAALVAAVAIVLITASAVMANHLTVTGAASCVDGNAVVTWTASSDEDETGKIYSSSRGVMTGLVVPGHSSASATETAAPGYLRMSIVTRFFPPGTSPDVSWDEWRKAVDAYKVRHPKWVEERPNWGDVTVPSDGCQPTTTTTTTTTTNPTTTTTTVPVTTTTVPVTTTTTPVTTTTVPVVTTTVPTTPTITQPIPRDSLGAVPGDKCPKANGVQTERPCQKLGPPLVDRPDQPTPPAATPALPDTGAGDNRPAAWFGVGAIVVGALMLAAGLLRKRGA